MKKLLLTIILAAVLLFGASALAEEVILPDPGYYFGRSYDDYMIEFDEYPEAEYDAYVKLLTEQYGMQITEEGGMGADEFVIMEKADVQNTEVFISCFESEYECGMEIVVDEGITLSALDTYSTRSSTEPGVIAWDDGRMIADPGDFLGYEIEVLETAEGDNAGGGFIKYKYASVPTTDILAIVDAIGESPYFEANDGGRQGKYYWLLFFNYVGSDEELSALCAGDRAERRGRDGDLAVYIFNPYSSDSEFALYQYPGFTINSESVQPDPIPNPDDDSLLKTCDACDGSGDCTYCHGKGYHWNDKNQDCSVSDRGKCSACDGKGHK